MSDSGVERGCVVTGVAGFVGSHLAERLLSMGHEVVGVDNFFSGHRENMATFSCHPAFTFFEADIREPELLDRLIEKHPKLDCCFHLAAVVSVPYSVKHPEETMEVNHGAVSRLLRSAVRTGLKNFVFAGSAAEYGDDQRMPLREEYATEQTHHLSPYGLAKFLASKEVATTPGGVALRFFNIYGPRQDPSSPYSGVISRFVSMAGKNEALTIFGDGLQSRDFVHVSDVVDAYIRAGGLAGPRIAVPAGVYNIGTGSRTTIVELAGVIQEIHGNTARLAFLPERPGDIRHSLASTDKFQTAAGWNAAVTLRDGLRDTIGRIG